MQWRILANMTQQPVVTRLCRIHCVTRNKWTCSLYGTFHGWRDRMGATGVCKADNKV